MPEAAATAEGMSTLEVGSSTPAGDDFVNEINLDRGVLCCRMSSFATLFLVLAWLVLSLKACGDSVDENHWGLPPPARPNL